MEVAMSSFRNTPGTQGGAFCHGEHRDHRGQAKKHGVSLDGFRHATVVLLCDLRGLCGSFRPRMPRRRRKCANIGSGESNGANLETETGLFEELWDGSVLMFDFANSRATCCMGKGRQSGPFEFQAETGRVPRIVGKPIRRNEP